MNQQHTPHTYFYKVVGEEGQVKRKIEETLQSNLNLDPETWMAGPHESWNPEPVFEKVSQESDEHYIYVAHYFNFGNPVQEDIYLDGEKLDGSRDLPPVDELREIIKERQRRQLKNQKDQLAQKLDQIEQQLQRIEEE